MNLQGNLLETTQADIEALIAGRVQEGPHIEFKRDLPVAWDASAKHELVADATAFANAGGGDLIFGVDENYAAEASSLVPQMAASIDAEVRRLQDFLLTLVEPRVPGLQVHAIPVVSGAIAGHVVVVRVPQSWATPHRVKTNQHVYVREGLRKRPLDVPELKALFLRTESQAQRVRDFRSDRLAKLVSGAAPVALQAGPLLIVHAIPTQSALGMMQLDPVAYSKGRAALPILGRSPAVSVRLNFDGACGIIPTRGEHADGYTQVFRQGYFESVWVLSPFATVPDPVLPGIAYEQYINQFLGQVRGDLERQGLQRDMAVFLSLLGAKKVVFAGPSGFGSGSEYRHFDRDDLLFPEVVIPAEVMPGRGMRPIYDLVCQSVGLERSDNYGPDGEWKSNRN